MTMNYSGDYISDSDGGKLKPSSSVMRNRIINGAMVLDQRNAGASTFLADGLYSLDRWKGSISQASKVSVQRSTTSTAGFTNSLGLTVSTAFTVGVGDYAGVLQPIEGYNVADLGFGTSAAKQITVSFKVRSSVTGTFCVALHNGAVNRSCIAEYTVNSANTFETKTVTFTGDTTGTWDTANGVGLVLYFAIGMGSTYSGATAGTWNSSLKLSTSNQTQFVQTSGATFYITGVQLEVGTSATGFEYRQYGQELALCQRYYQQLGSAVGIANSTTGFTGAIQFLTQMRATPTTSLTNRMSITDTYSADFTQSSSSISFSGGNRVNSLGMNFDLANFSGLTSGRVYLTVPVSYQNGIIAMSAEL